MARRAAVGSRSAEGPFRKSELHLRPPISPCRVSLRQSRFAEKLGSSADGHRSHRRDVGVPAGRRWDLAQVKPAVRLIASQCFRAMSSGHRPGTPCVARALRERPVPIAWVTPVGSRLDSVSMPVRAATPVAAVQDAGRSRVVRRCRRASVVERLQRLLGKKSKAHRHFDNGASDRLHAQFRISGMSSP